MLLILKEHAESLGGVVLLLAKPKPDVKELLTVPDFKRLFTIIDYHHRLPFYPQYKNA